MVGEYIQLKPEDGTLNDYLKFTITKSAMKSIHQNTEIAARILQEFSRSTVLLFTKSEQDSNNLFVFTDQGIYRCITQDQELLVRGFERNNLKRQSIALKYGTCFSIDKGIIVKISLNAPYNMYTAFCNGNSYSLDKFRDYDTSESVNKVLDLLNQTGNEDKSEKVQAEYSPEKRLAKLLDISESYTLLSSQLEEKKAIESGKVAYHDIMPVSYTRVDKIAYEFKILSVDENIFKPGTRVEIEDTTQEKHSAEIISLTKEIQEKPVTGVVLLFEKQLSLEDFPNIGWFHLTVSTVNRDVQLTANGKIREGKAKAKYLDSIIGLSKSEGFETKNLDETLLALQNKKYPPNQSQMDAIVKGIKSKDAFFVMGPPGTGKTTVILEWVKYFVKKENKRVLISSQNNKAVDNVLARIADDKEIDVIRIGSESKLQSDIIPYMFENKVAALRKSISESIQDKVRWAKDLHSIWGEYNKNTRYAFEVYNYKILQMDIIKNNVEMKLKPMDEKLRLIQHKLKEIEREITKSRESIQELREKIEKNDRQEKKLIKIIGSVISKINANKVSKEMKNLQASISSYKYYSGSYVEANKMRMYHFENIMAECYSKLHLLNKDLIKWTEILLEKPQYYANNIWKIFDSVYQIKVSEEDIPKLHLAVDMEYQRMTTLIELMKTWENDMLSKQNYALNEIVLDSVDLVGATCIGINSQKRFANLDFDITIIDEAGQIQIHNALVPMSVSNKVIMLGDHKQIPPTADQELLDVCSENNVETEYLHKSLFEVMYESMPGESKMMLDTQYRLPAEIADTISDFFYEKQYYSPSFKRKLSGCVPALSLKPYIFIDTSYERGRHETTIESGGCENLYEAKIIEMIMSHITENTSLDLREVGIITAYKAQVSSIKKLLEKKISRDVVDEMVATLDSFQGQERDLIIYSFTKSSMKPRHMRRIGFLNELRRLNVAMTRCKKTLILVGDLEFLKSCEHQPRDDDGEFIYQSSEKQFSDFITKIEADILKGAGEVITYRQFIARMKDERYD